MTPNIEGVPGPAKIKQTYSSSVLKIGETESVGGTDETATPLQCEDPEGGCRVYLVFNP